MSPSLSSLDTAHRTLGYAKCYGYLCLWAGCCTYRTNLIWRQLGHVVVLSMLLFMEPAMPTPGHPVSLIDEVITKIKVGWVNTWRSITLVEYVKFCWKWTDV